MMDDEENFGLAVLFQEAPLLQYSRSTWSPAKRLRMASCSTLPIEDEEEEDWLSDSRDDSGVCSLSDLISGLLHQDCLVDVNLLVGEPAQRFSAHRLVLVAASPVFKAQFSGPLAPPLYPIPEIEIPDVSPAGFEVLLQYAYSDRSTSLMLSRDTALQTLMAAKKYLMEDLLCRCIRYLARTVSVENVLTVLAHAVLLDEYRLKDLCLRLVEAQTEEVLVSKEWVSAELVAVSAVLSRDGLTCREVKLLEALMKWGAAEQQRRECTTSVYDLLVEENLLSYIRFGAMSVQELQEIVQPLHILSSEEMLQTVFDSVSGKVPGRCFTGTLPEVDLLLLYSVPHLNKTCERLLAATGDCRRCRCDPAELNPRATMALYGGVEVRTNTRLLLAGLQLFGAPGYPQVKLCLRVECLQSGKTLLELRRNQLQTSCSRRLICTHDLHFPQPVVLHPGCWYMVHLSTEGPLPAYMCDRPASRVVNRELGLRFRKPRKHIPYSSFLSGLYYVILPLRKPISVRPTTYYQDTSNSREYSPS